MDPDGVIHALERAAQLMAALGGGRVVAPGLDDIPGPHASSPAWACGSPGPTGSSGLNYPTGPGGGFVEAPAPAGHRCLDQENLAVQVPSFRRDLDREMDLIEEVARLGGFEEIPVTLPRGVVATPRPGPGHAPQERGPATSPGPGLL